MEILVLVLIALAVVLMTWRVAKWIFKTRRGSGRRKMFGLHLAAFVFYSGALWYHILTYEPHYSDLPSLDLEQLFAGLFWFALFFLHVFLYWLTAEISFYRERKKQFARS